RLFITAEQVVSKSALQLLFLDGLTERLGGFRPLGLFEAAKNRLVPGHSEFLVVGRLQEPFAGLLDESLGRFGEQAWGENVRRVEEQVHAPVEQVVREALVNLLGQVVHGVQVTGRLAATIGVHVLLELRGEAKLEHLLVDLLGESDAGKLTPGIHAPRKGSAGPAQIGDLTGQDRWLLKAGDIGRHLSLVEEPEPLGAPVQPGHSLSALDTPEQDSGHTVDLADARAQEEKVEGGEKQIVDGRSIKEVDQLADVPRVLTPGLQPSIPSPPVRLDLVPVPPQVQLNGEI